MNSIDLAFIVLGFAACALAGVQIYKFFYVNTNADKINSIKAWLLIMVAEAEKELGSNTGRLKLSYVYSEFVKTFPAIAAILTFEEFSALVDEVLVDFRSMLQSNKSIKEYVENQ